MDTNTLSGAPAPTPGVMAPQNPVTSMPAPKKSRRGILLTLIVVLLCAVAYGAYAYVTALWPFDSTAVVSPSVSPSTSEKPSGTPLPIGVKTYTSQALGIAFEYLTSQGSPVLEEGDTVYVGGAQGQWVRVFSKEASDDLKTAITKTFLSGVPAGKCIVEVAAAAGAPNITTGSINFDFTPSDPGDPRIDASPCPAEYRATNGIRYFWMDSNHPGRFFFFSIGQYAIPASPEGMGGGKTWQDTFRVIDPPSTALLTAGWQTYTNVKYGFEFKYPTEWEISEHSGNGFPQIFAIPKNSFETDRIAGLNVSIMTQRQMGDHYGEATVVAKMAPPIAGRVTYELMHQGEIGGPTKVSYISLGDGFLVFSREPDNSVAETVLATFTFIDATSEWKTYRTSKCCLQFDYPATWTVEEVTPDAIAVFADAKLRTGGAQITIERYENPDSLSPEQWVRANKDASQIGSALVADVVNGRPAVRFVENGLITFDAVYVKVGTPIYSFTVGQTGYSDVHAMFEPLLKTVTYSGF